MNIPTGEDILAQNNFVPLKRAVTATADDPVSSMEALVTLMRQRLEQQRRLKAAVDSIVREVLGSE